jgi:uncharacterized protein (DUF779 family)
VKTGSKSLQKPPHLPLILGSNQSETNSHKNLVKSLTSGRGGGYSDERKMVVRPKLSFGLRSGRC